MTRAARNSQWTAAPAPKRVSLLRDPELRDAIPTEDLDEATGATLVPAVEVATGNWLPSDVDVGRRASAALLLEGVLCHEVDIAGRRSAHVYGPHDVVDPWADRDLILPSSSTWMSSGTAVLAVLDDRFAAAVRRWPDLAGVIDQRRAQQMRELELRIAIASLPRVEQRVLGVFWVLAERWGIVTAEGVRITLRLTHEVIGRMVGSQRPTVSLALGALAEARLLARTEDRSWMLAHESQQWLLTS